MGKPLQPKDRLSEGCSGSLIGQLRGLFCLIFGYLIRIWFRFRKARGIGYPLRSALLHFGLCNEVARKNTLCGRCKIGLFRPSIPVG